MYLRSPFGGSIVSPSASMDEGQAQQGLKDTPQSGLAGGVATALGGPGDGAKPKYDSAAEMKQLYGKPMKYDNNTPAYQVAASAAKKMGVDPALLFSSAFQEGMNQAITKPDDVSEAYNYAMNGKFKNGTQTKLNSKDYPVDGFLNYGLDTFGQRYNDLKKYLPQGFEQRFQTYQALNDHMKKDPATGKMVPDPQPVTTAAFKTNEDALMAKAALLRSGSDKVDEFAKANGMQLSDKAKNYFNLAFYNSGEGGMKAMMKEYAAAKDKDKFIDEGQTSHKDIHNHIAPRMKNMLLAQQLMQQHQGQAQSQPPIPSPTTPPSKK